MNKNTNINYIIEKLLFIISEAKNAFTDLKLANKFIICFTTLIALPIIFVGTYLFNNIKGYITSEAIYQQETIAQITKNGIDEKINICKNVATSVVGTKEIVNYINDTSSYTFDKLYSTKTTIYTSMRSIIDSKNISNLRIFADNKDMIEIPPLIMHQQRLLNTPVLSSAPTDGQKEFWIFNQAQNLIINSEAVTGKVVYYYKNKTNSISKSFIVEVTMPINVFVMPLKKYNYKNDILCFISYNDILVGDYLKHKARQ